MDQIDLRQLYGKPSEFSARLSSVCTVVNILLNSSDK